VLYSSDDEGQPGSPNVHSPNPSQAQLLLERRQALPQYGSRPRRMLLSTMQTVTVSVVPQLDVALNDIEPYLWMAGLTPDKIRRLHHQKVVERRR
jgi:hypothetical protein